MNKILIITCFAIMIIGTYHYGRSIWFPMYVKIIGKKTIDDRISEIKALHPDLVSKKYEKVTIIVYKNPGIVQVVEGGNIIEEYKMTAQSGKIGPKIKSGDGQIPEGIYKIETLNPNSSYHLSMRVNYPNDDDKIRSAQLNISDLGGDIYIHGKRASIGCVAIGDWAIERLFYIVHESGINNIKVIIAPYKEDKLDNKSDNNELYSKIYNEINEIMKRAQQGVAPEPVMYQKTIRIHNRPGEL